jgi:hypothetical protein
LLKATSHVMKNDGARRKCSHATAAALFRGSESAACKIIQHFKALEWRLRGADLKQPKDDCNGSDRRPSV